MPNRVPCTWCSTMSTQLRQQAARACRGPAWRRTYALAARGRTTASRRPCDRGPRCSPSGNMFGIKAVADVVRRTCAGCSPASAMRPVDERQPFEADHRVAAPVGEPVIAGDHGAHLVAQRRGAGRVLDASGRRDEELIGREDELRTRDRGASGPASTAVAAAARFGRSASSGTARASVPRSRSRPRASPLARREIDPNRPGVHSEPRTS